MECMSGEAREFERAKQGKEGACMSRGQDFMVQEMKPDSRQSSNGNSSEVGSEEHQVQIDLNADSKATVVSVAGSSSYQSTQGQDADDEALHVGQGHGPHSKRKLHTIDKSAIPFPKRVKRKPGFDQNMFDETCYIFKNGLRYVQPYYFTFTAYCKERWFGKTVLDVFKKEFRLETAEFYENAIKNGNITVNDEIVTTDRILKNNDLLKTKIHRHEPPVVDMPLEFVENNDDIVVINKPSSIPVHPCGRYRHNTIVFILGKDYNLKNLHTVHRIDRLTSGILMFAKTKGKAQELEKAVKGRNIHKEYVCRVEGEFPEGKVTCDKPIHVVSHKVGVCRVSDDGKPCSTDFERLSYNGKISVVRCTPHTGRMHQIRVHLQWIGFPIENDPIYNHPFAWGSNKGQGGTERTTEQVLEALASTRKENIVNNKAAMSDMLRQEKVSCSGQVNLDMIEGNLEKKTVSKESVKTTEHDSSFDVPVNEKNLNDSNSFDRDPACSDCKLNWQDPDSSELVMYLHALSYKGDGWEYKTKIPKWVEAIQTIVS